MPCRRRIRPRDLSSQISGGYRRTVQWRCCCGNYTTDL